MIIIDEFSVNDISIEQLKTLVTDDCKTFGEKFKQNRTMLDGIPIVLTSNDPPTPALINDSGLKSRLTIIHAVEKYYHCNKFQQSNNIDNINKIPNENNYKESIHITKKFIVNLNLESQICKNDFEVSINTVLHNENNQMDILEFDDLKSINYRQKFLDTNYSFENEKPIFTMENELPKNYKTIKLPDEFNEIKNNLLLNIIKNLEINSRASKHLPTGP